MMSAPAPAAQTSQLGTSDLGRRLFRLLAAVALIYAFFCGLRTISDPDLFWQLATGRWVAQHHHVFSTDVFSYTAAGKPWIYPAGSGLLLYWTYLLGGYSLLSWLGAAVAVGTVALLMRKGTVVSAALAIVAVPLVAARTSPRAEMFTVILFTAYLSILWENYRSSRARLWLLPPLMLLWVNCHLGFVSGLGLIGAFIGLDILEMFRGDIRRQEALQRLRRAAPWFAAAALCTLANPWGWNIYQAVLRQNRAMAEHSMWIAEWGKVPLDWRAVSSGLVPWHGNPFYLLLVVVIVTVLYAIWRRQFGPAILLLAATYPGLQHVRMTCLSACVIVIVGGAILSGALAQLSQRRANERARRFSAAVAVALLICFAVVQSFEKTKLNETALSTYGAGASWWFPERAIQFIQRENIPGEIFNTYIQGGYLIWTLGPERRDYMDGRAIPFGTQAFLNQAEILHSPPDSSVWSAEADRYNINAVILPTNRFEWVLGEIKQFCTSANWRPVYLDEAAAVFVRRKPETEELIRRSNVSCSSIQIPSAPIEGSATTRFNHWADSASLLAAIGRNTEALAAANEAYQIYPGSGFVPWLRGNIYYQMGMHEDAEREYQSAITVGPEVPLYWFSLAVVYKHDGRIAEAIDAQRRAIDFSTMPQPGELIKLARAYLENQQPKKALDTFEEAVRSASPELLAARGAASLSFEADQGRATAWRALGDTGKAAAYDQKAAQDLIAPDGSNRDR